MVKVHALRQCVSQLSGQKPFRKTRDFLDSGTQDGLFEQRDQEPSPSRGAGDGSEHTLSKKHWVPRNQSRNICYPRSIDILSQILHIQTMFVKFRRTVYIMQIHIFYYFDNQSHFCGIEYEFKRCKCTDSSSLQIVESSGVSYTHILKKFMSVHLNTDFE